MLFPETYAMDRRDAGKGYRVALKQMVLWLSTGVPFCYIRYLDGEFKSILGAEGSNCDGHDYMPSTLGVALAQTLGEVAGLCPRHGNVLVGGGSFNITGVRAYLRESNLFTRVPWAPANAFVAGMKGLKTLAFLHAIAARDGCKVLVSNKRVRDAAICLGADWVEIPERNCWLERQRILRELREKLRLGGLVIYCAGMPSAVFAWRLWIGTPHTSHVDMGSFFDGAFDHASRAWFKKDTGARRSYFKHIAPILRSGQWPSES